MFEIYVKQRKIYRKFSDLFETYVKRSTSKTGFSNRFWNCQFATYVKRDTSIFYLLHCYLICVTELTSFLSEQSSSSSLSPLFPYRVPCLRPITSFGLFYSVIMYCKKTPRLNLFLFSKRRFFALFRARPSACCVSN